MDLTAFIKKTVKPGEPLTAQGWNDLVEAIDSAYQFLRSTMHTVRVKVSNEGLDFDDVRVTATRAGGAPVEGVPPVEGQNEFVLSRLEVGGWTINVHAKGFQTATKAVDIAEAGETKVEIALQQIGPFMPDLFGLSYTDASAVLATAGIPVVRVLDFTGRELPPNNPGDENKGAPVVVQWPPAHESMPPNVGARLVLAVSIQVEPAVEMPSLAGLTQQEAQKALESVGLQLGKVSFLQK